MTTSIEWARNADGSAGETWNPTTGCDKVSPGCDNCYAARMAQRLAGRFGYPADEPFRLTLHPDRLVQPLQWRKPRTVFVNSMSDLFHPAVPDDFIGRIFAAMAEADRHTFQVLTKRPQRMAQLDLYRLALAAAHEEDPRRGLGPNWQIAPFQNVWLGTSIESDRYVFRADHLRQTSAAVRFLSLEPLLGPLPSLDLTGIDWVIVGGESGPHARPMRHDWVCDIRDRCADAGVPFFFKQWGAWAPNGVFTAGLVYENDRVVKENPGVWVEPDGSWRPVHDALPSPGATLMRRVGKHAAGRNLDGCTWDEMPERVEIPA